MVKFAPLMIALILWGLFSFALIQMGIQLADSNNANQSIADDPAIASFNESVKNILEELETDVNSSETAISEPSLISSIRENIIIDAIGGVWKVLKNVPTSLYNIATGLWKSEIFQGPLIIVIGTIGAILTLVVIIAVWRMLFTGEGD